MNDFNKATKSLLTKKMRVSSKNKEANLNEMRRLKGFINHGWTNALSVEELTSQYKKEAFRIRMDENIKEEDKIKVLNYLSSDFNRKQESMISLNTEANDLNIRGKASICRGR